LIFNFSLPVYKPKTTTSQKQQQAKNNNKPETTKTTDTITTNKPRLKNTVKNTTETTEPREVREDVWTDILWHGKYNNTCQRVEFIQRTKPLTVV
jgi:hypothetical protein